MEIMKSLGKLMTAVLLTLTLCSCSSDNNDEAPNQAPEAFDLIAIGDGAIEVEVDSPTFSWNPAIDPEGGPISYQLILGTNINPTNFIVNNNSNTTHTFPYRLRYMEQWFWKVIATDNAGKSTTSETFSFKTRNLKFPSTAVNPNPMFSPRYGHRSVVFNNKMWVIAGYDGVLKNDVWNSSDGITWTQLTASAGFTPRFRPTSVVFNNKIWIIGGNVNEDGTNANDVWSSPDGITWTQVTAAAPFSSRQDHTSVVFDDKIWVIGGNEGGTAYRNDVWSSSDGLSWTPVANAPEFTARRGHTSIVFDNKMWVIAGNDSGLRNDVWSSSNGVDWISVAEPGQFNSSWYHTSVVFDYKMWVIGGSGNNDAFGSTDGTEWTPVSTAPNTPTWRRHSHTSLVFDDKVWVIGGFDNNIPGGLTNNVSVLE